MSRTGVCENGTLSLLGSYPASKVCNYLVTAPSGKQVTLTFANFSVEYISTFDCTSDIKCSNCTYDHVTLYDGTSKVGLFTLGADGTT